MPQNLPFVGVATSTLATTTGVQATATLTPSRHASSSPAEVIRAVIQVATTTIKDIVKPLVSARAPEVAWKRGIATVFWVGEGEDEDNGFISNVPSAWDEKWMQHYGGVDTADERCGDQPCDFEPKENPFYIALPYNDLDDNGDTKQNANRIPWYHASEKSILKNRWRSEEHTSNSSH